MGVSAPLFSLDKIDSIDVFAHILYTLIMPNIHLWTFQSPIYIQ